MATLLSTKVGISRKLTLLRKHERGDERVPEAGKATLTQFLIEERRRAPGATGDLNALITDVSLACKAISRKVAYGALGGMLGNDAGAAPVSLPSTPPSAP